MTKSSSYTIAISAFVLVVLLGVFGFLIYQGFVYKSEIAARAIEAEEAASHAQSRSSLRRALEGSQKDIDVIDARFISEDAVPDFIGMLERIGSREGISMTIGSIQLGTENAQGVRPLTLRITGEGSWERVVRFISVLDALPYVLRIDSVQVEQIMSEEVPSGTWRLSVDIRQSVAK